MKYCYLLLLLPLLFSCNNQPRTEQQIHEEIKHDAQANDVKNNDTVSDYQICLDAIDTIVKMNSIIDSINKKYKGTDFYKSKTYHDILVTRLTAAADYEYVLQQIADDSLKNLLMTRYKKNIPKENAYYHDCGSEPNSFIP